VYLYCLSQSQGLWVVTSCM